MQHVYDRPKNYEKSYFEELMWMMEITLLDLFYTWLGAITSCNVLCVFLWCAERNCFPKATVISTDARLQPSSFYSNSLSTLITSKCYSVPEYPTLKASHDWRPTAEEYLMSQRVFQPNEHFKDGRRKTEWQLSHWEPLGAHPQVTEAWSGAEELRPQGNYTDCRKGSMCW